MPGASSVPAQRSAHEKERVLAITPITAAVSRIT